MTSSRSVGAALLTGLFLTAGVAVAAGPPKQADVEACNKEAASMRKGKSSATAPGSATPGSGPSGGQGSTQNRPMDSTTGQQGKSGDSKRSSEITKGMAPAGESDPAYRASYLECLKKRGYTS
jgi:hypothetical protein